MDMLLEKIIEYNMDEDEAKAWKVAILYLTLVKDAFPDYKHCRIPKGDPRKSSLFKYCYKLTRERDLHQREYKEYIKAQFHILKNIELEDGVHPRIDVNCLVSKSAWNRWMLWKSKIKKASYSETLPQDTHHILKALDDTRAFLNRKFGGVKEKDILDSLESRAIFRWCVLQQVSGYYLVLSPIVAQWMKDKGVNLMDIFAIDLEFYRKGITPEVEEHFKKWM